MRSPFPGMDPYLEARWDDVHTGLCIGIRTALQAHLPAGLRARAQQRVLLEGYEDEEPLLQRYQTDIAVAEHERVHASSTTQSSVTAVGEAIELRLMPEETRERWVEIIDTTSNNRVVTVIEILSPGNKESGELNKRYREKVRRYINTNVNFVEIDLLRSSRDRLYVKTEYLPLAKQTPYLTCIVKPDDDPFLWRIYPMPLRSQLPTIPIPCRATDDDVPLSLQPLIDQIYLEGGHDDIDYKKPLREPFSAEDAAWAAELVAAAR